MKKLLLLPAILLLIGAGCTLQKPIQNENNNPESNKIIGGNVDEHGCLGPAGYSWCETKQTCLRVWEEWCSDETNKMAQEIEQSTGIKFTTEETNKMDWNTEQGTMILTGTKHYIDGNIEDIPKVYDKIFSHLKDSYTLDKYNSSDGMTNSKVGFIKNYTACTLLSNKPYGLEEGPNSEIMEITLECGLFNPNITAEENVQKEIVGLFVTKYNKQTSEININIEQQTEKHIRGRINFLNEQGKIGEGGIFLATKIDGTWQLIFDGNGGIYCLLLSRHNFPQEMMGDCYWPEGDKQNNSTNINNFKDCADAGNPVMESYPRQCQHEDKIFTEEITQQR